ncbi:MAG: hydroxyacid dehydrogenase [Planctomycetota bacterium]|nr:hydroxyacid dehydrogenase [Planctomycetota bacterium]
MSQPVILFDPFPRTKDLILTAEDFARLENLGEVVAYPELKVPDAFIDEHLPEAVALIGQTAMPKERLDKAPKLRAILNVEGNFLPNVDYDECHRRNVHVLACAPAFAHAVAETALGFAIACARGIVEGDQKFRAGSEAYGGSGNQESFLLRGKTLGLIGCGNVGRALIPLLKAFGGELLVHDPWVHPRILKDLGLVPAGLNELLQRSQIVFVMAAATTENKKGLGAEHFSIMKKGAALILVGRSDVLDFDALLDAAQAGHLKAAIDVFPDEPMPADHRVRRTPNTILSAHRAGGIPETYKEIGRMAVDDLEMILRGLPPQRMQKALPETVARYRGKPVSGPGK